MIDRKRQHTKTEKLQKFSNAWPWPRPKNRTSNASDRVFVFALMFAFVLDVWNFPGAPDKVLIASDKFI